MAMPLAVLAVIKAGGAYVPLDPAYPADRLARDDCATQRPGLVITSELSPPACPPSAPPWSSSGPSQPGLISLTFRRRELPALKISLTSFSLLVPPAGPKGWRCPSGR